MIPATMKDPMPAYNPMAIFDLKPMNEVSELRLLVSNRYCDIDLNTSIAYFYLELTDGTNKFIIPARYYEWLAAQEAEEIFCHYIKVRKGNTFHNVLEISRIPKTYLEFGDAESLVNPLANGNVVLQQDYVPLHKEIVPIIRVLQKQSDILYIGMATATLNNGLYVKAYSHIKDLFTMGRVGIQYRYLNINQKIITDVEVFSDEF